MQPPLAHLQGPGINAFRLTFLISDTAEGVYRASDGERDYLLMDRACFDQVLKSLNAMQASTAGNLSIPLFEGIEVFDDAEKVGAIVARCLLDANQQTRQDAFL